jgi:hypothetical protein
MIAGERQEQAQHESDQLPGTPVGTVVASADAVEQGAQAKRCVDEEDANSRRRARGGTRPRQLAAPG